MCEPAHIKWHCLRTLFGAMRRTDIASGVVPKSMRLDQALPITSTSRDASTMSSDTVEVSLISSTRAVCVSSLTTRRQVAAGDAKNRRDDVGRVESLDRRQLDQLR